MENFTFFPQEAQPLNQDEAAKCTANTCSLGDMAHTEIHSNPISFSIALIKNRAACGFSFLSIWGMELGHVPFWKTYSCIHKPDGAHQMHPDFLMK